MKVVYNKRHVFLKSRAQKLHVEHKPTGNKKNTEY